MKHRHDGALGVLCRFSVHSLSILYTVLRSGVAVETLYRRRSARL